MPFVFYDTWKLSWWMYLLNLLHNRILQGAQRRIPKIFGKNFWLCSMALAKDRWVGSHNVLTTREEEEPKMANVKPSSIAQALPLNFAQLDLFINFNSLSGLWIERKFFLFIGMSCGGKLEVLLSAVEHGWTRWFDKCDSKTQGKYVTM